MDCKCMADVVFSQMKFAMIIFLADYADKRKNLCPLCAAFHVRAFVVQILWQRIIPFILIILHHNLALHIIKLQWKAQITSLAQRNYILQLINFFCRNTYNIIHNSRLNF